MYKKQNNGFTLIELLVVVLIIGILAAVAVPKYRFATDKTRVMKLVTMVKQIQTAQDAYYLANGNYAQQLDQLDLSFGGTLSDNRGRQNAILTLPDGIVLKLSPFDAGWGYFSGNAVMATDPLLPNMGIFQFYKYQPAGSTWPSQRLACYSQGQSEQSYSHLLCRKITQKKMNHPGDNRHGGWWQAHYFK